jgi:hypothetical protein
MLKGAPADATDIKPEQAGAIPLNTREAETLVLLREDEKLARDVYRALYTYWRQPSWLEAMQQRQARMDRIARLLKQYELPDPLPDNRPGSFPSPELAELYAQLVKRGAQSYVDAFDVGIQIEQLDIADLQAAILESRHETLDQSYQVLLESSRYTLDQMSHMRQIVARR